MPRTNYLLIIGIDTYLNPEIDDLNNSVLDCKRLIDVLSNKYNFNLIAEPLFNEEATRSAIINLLHSLSYTILPEDNLVIYFAGHGKMNPSSGKGFWVPYDAKDLASDFISNAQLKDILDDIDAKHIFLIADACFSGTFITKPRSMADADFAYEKLDKLKSRYALTSGRDEIVKDGLKGKGSLFSNSLIQCLSNNDNKYLSTLEIINFVLKGVGKIAKQQPLGSHIEDLGHEGGQMIFIKSDSVNEMLLTKDQFNDLMRVYGYEYGQKKSLEAIRNKFPDLENEIDRAEIEWYIEFRSSIEAVINKLKKIGGAEWEAYDQRMKDKVDSLIKIPEITIEMALDSIRTIKERASGVIESPVLETLLANNPDFIANPMGEMGKYSQKLSSQEHEKAKGLHFEIELPKTWQVKEAKRPNVLWVISDREKKPILSVEVQKIAKYSGMSESEVSSFSDQEIADELFTEKSLTEAIPAENPTEIIIDRTKVDGCECGIVEYKGAISRVTFEIQAYFRTYYIVYKGYLLIFHFFTPFKKEEEAALDTKYYRTFFNRIIGTLVMQSKYI